MLQNTAKIVSGLLGRESWAVRAARPAYESMLDLIYKRSGMPWSINGSQFRIDPHHRHRLGNEYDPSVAEFFRTRIRSGQTCFDIGANVGVYVLQFANWLRPSGRVVAFEPNPGARSVLEYHVRINGISDRVTIVPSAVGQNSGTATLYAAGADGMSRLNAPNTAIADKVRPVDVPVISVDDYVSQSGITPDTLMVDIEGFEIAAIAGAKRLIKEKRDLLIVVEMHPNVWHSAGTTRTSAQKLLDELELIPLPLQGQSDTLGDHATVHLQQRELV
jgi:FkbM family methyltransferase